jgi:predicted extracellular nuclease
LSVGITAGCIDRRDPTVELIGAASIDRGTVFSETVIGGLSGLAYDPWCGLYYAVSDDRGGFGPPRFYALSLDPPAGVTPVSMVVLRDDRGRELPPGSVDLEAIAVAPDGTVWVASEGMSGFGVPSFIRRFGADGVEIDELPIPDHLQPAKGRGVRHNLGIEGLAVTPDGASLFVAVENALLQDGPAADLERGSPARIIRYDIGAREVDAEFVYPVDPVPVASNSAGGEQVNGVTDILVLDRRRLLVLERSYSSGVGNTVRLYEADLGVATDVSKIQSLSDRDRTNIRPAAKTLVFDLAIAGLAPDNIEGMTFGPELADGRRLLVLVSDDNFNPRQQPTMLVSLAVGGAPAAATAPPELRVRDIQGAAHKSPVAGRCVAGVQGVVTAVVAEDGERTAWIQDPVADRDPATSEGLVLDLGSNWPEVRVGDLVSVDGPVAERGFGVGLSTTTIVAWRLDVASRGRPLPEPVVLGTGGRSIPGVVVDDDGLTVFEPAADAIDFFESLEAMRVRVDDGVVVGPTSVHGEIAVLADGGSGVRHRTFNGGLARRPGVDHPAQILVDDRIVGSPPMLRTGDRLSESIVGILDYSFGSFKLLNPERLPGEVSGTTTRGTTDLVSGDGLLTIATLNAENLSAVSPQSKHADLADIVVRRLRSPDIVAVQEIQDDSGSKDDGSTGAARTLRRLTGAITNAGGPRYRWRQIDPGNRRDGGRPGANIRVAFLFNPDRVAFVDRRGAGREAEIIPGPGISPSPGLVEPGHPAFAGDPDRRFDSSRKSLVGEFEVGGRRLFVVNLHLVSKRRDDPVFGTRRPPRLWSEEQRSEQARAIRRFVDRILEEDSDAAVVVLGDLNEFEYRPPLRILTGGGLVNLTERVPVEDRYSYIFQGLSQTLDHILVSPYLAQRAEIDMVHVNADFPHKERASDHDPVIARVALDE